MIGASGKEAELRALEHLRRRGFELVKFHYRTREGEIDLIVKKGGLLVFVEVKGTQSLVVDPAERVDEKKRARLLAAAERYLAESGWEGEVRFDVVSVSPHGVFHLEDAFRG